MLRPPTPVCCACKAAGGDRSLPAGALLELFARKPSLLGVGMPSTPINTSRCLAPGALSRKLLSVSVSCSAIQQTTSECLRWAGHCAGHRDEMKTDSSPVIRVLKHEMHNCDRRGSVSVTAMRVLEKSSCLGSVNGCGAVSDGDACGSSVLSLNCFLSDGQG